MNRDRRYHAGIEDDFMKSFSSHAAAKLMLLMLVAFLISYGQAAAQTAGAEKRSHHLGVE